MLLAVRRASWQWLFMERASEKGRYALPPLSRESAQTERGRYGLTTLGAATLCHRVYLTTAAPITR